VAKIAETVSQPVMGQIRLQWWRDAIGRLWPLVSARTLCRTPCSRR
jgi:hypothetical protein